MLVPILHDPLHTTSVDGVEVQRELLRLLGLCELSNLLLEVGVLLLQLRVFLLDALHGGSVLQRGAELLSHKTVTHIAWIPALSHPPAARKVNAEEGKDGRTRERCWACPALRRAQPALLRRNNQQNK